MQGERKRPETGPMEFQEDWPGVFIRGDEAMGMAMYLEMKLNGVESPIYDACLRGLVATLRGCDARNSPNVQRAMLLPDPSEYCSREPNHDGPCNGLPCRWRRDG
jgi:hypothetical protein